MSRALLISPIVISIIALVISITPFLVKAFLTKKVKGFYTYDFLKIKAWRMVPKLQTRWIQISKLEYIGKNKPFKDMKNPLFGVETNDTDKSNYFDNYHLHKDGYHVFSYMDDMFRLCFPIAWVNDKKISKLILLKIPKDTENINKKNMSNN